MRLADIHFRTAESAMIAQVTGEIDLSNAEQISRVLERTTPNHVLALVLDLSQVDYLDSAGIQLIFRVRERVHARGQRLRLVIGEDAPSRDALRLAGVEGAVPIATTVHQALIDVETRDAVNGPGVG